MPSNLFHWCFVHGIISVIDWSCCWHDWLKKVDVILFLLAYNLTAGAPWGAIVGCKCSSRTYESKSFNAKISSKPLLGLSNIMDVTRILRNPSAFYESLSNIPVYMSAIPGPKYTKQSIARHIVRTYYYWRITDYGRDKCKRNCGTFSYC